MWVVGTLVIADMLRGPYRPPQYERVMMPMTVLRRFDCVLQPSKAKVIAEYKRNVGSKATGKGGQGRVSVLLNEDWTPETVSRHSLRRYRTAKVSVRVAEFHEVRVEPHHSNLASIVLSGGSALGSAVSTKLGEVLEV